MIDNYLTVIPKDVDALRVEFRGLQPLLPLGWRNIAGEINPFFKTAEGYKALIAVVNKRGRLEVTRLVLEVVKKILEITPEPQRDQSAESAGEILTEQPTEL